MNCVWLLLQNRPESVAITIMLNLRSLARSFLTAYLLPGLAASMDSASDYLLLVFIIRIKGKCLEAGKTVHWSGPWPGCCSNWFTDRCEEAVTFGWCP